MASSFSERLVCSSAEDVCSIVSKRKANDSALTDPPRALVQLARRQNALIERRSMLFKLQSSRPHDNSGRSRHKLGRARGRRFYRCDIHATSAEDERSAATECKQLVLEAGGVILDNYQYLGGFLFELPPGGACPIDSGDATEGGGSIVVEPWQPFCLDESPRAAAIANQEAEDRTSKRLSGRIEDFFKRKKLVPATDGAASSDDLREPKSNSLTLLDMLQEGQVRSPPRESTSDNLTLLEMLREGQVETPLRDQMETTNDADWETLFDGSENEWEDPDDWPTSCDPALRFRAA